MLPAVFCRRIACTRALARRPITVLAPSGCVVRTPRQLPASMMYLRAPVRMSHMQNDSDLSYEEFNEKYRCEFQQVEDLFDLQRCLNSAFYWDVVPSVEVCEEALQACRRMNDYGTAVRLLQALHDKCPRKSYYEQYLAALKPMCDELGVETKEQLNITDYQ